jgi:hypothetical protein
MCLLLAATLCAATLPAQSSTRELLMADSVILERTHCYGTCPAYRLSITRSGRVSFTSRNPGERIARTSTIDSTQYREITSLASFAHFLQLPDKIASNKQVCGHEISDFPTATVTIFMASGSKSVEDYGGCAWAPWMLRRLEDKIDEIANSKRWVRPRKIEGDTH